MELPKKNKLMLMFLTPANPLLKRLVCFATGKPLALITLDEEDITTITGVSRETPKNWASGGTSEDPKATAFFKASWTTSSAPRDERKHPPTPAEEQEYRALRDAIAGYDKRFAESGLRIDVYETARTLGMPVDECQQTIDTAIYDRHPLLPSVYYPSKEHLAGTRDWAEEEMSRYEGIYLMWVRRGDSWLQAPLRVRYLQPQNAHKGQVRFIRCKLNFPNIRPGTEPPWHEYDGFVSIRPNRLYWTFEKRLSERQDYFHLITNVAGPRGTSLSLHGRYLTTAQDEEQSIVTNDVYFDHMFTEREDPFHRRYRDLMWTGAKAISDPEELRKVEQRWQALQVPSAASAASR